MDFNLECGFISILFLSTMGNSCSDFCVNSTNEKLKSRKLSINVLYNKQKVLKIKKLAIKKVTPSTFSPRFLFNCKQLCRKGGQMRILSKFWTKPRRSWLKEVLPELVPRRGNSSVRK